MRAEIRHQQTILAETLIWKSEPETMSTKIRDRDAKKYMHAKTRFRDSAQKVFRDFEIGWKFAETQDFRKTIRHPYC